MFDTFIFYLLSTYITKERIEGEVSFYETLKLSAFISYFSSQRVGMYLCIRTWKFLAVN